MAFENNVQATLQANVAIGATTVDVVKAVAPNKDVPASGRLTLSATGKTEIISYTGRTNPVDSQTFAVTAVGGNYIISSVANKALTLKAGSTYIFTYPSGHPFRFSTTSDGTHGSGSEYTTGVTHNSSTQTTIIVSDSTPTTLYYYCSYHSNMGGDISVISYWTLTGVTKNAESSFGDQAWSAGDACFQALTAADVANFTTVHSSTAPTNPIVGAKWFNTTTGVLQEYLSDGTDSAWLDISSGTTVGTAATTTATVIAPIAQGYINSENSGTAAGCSYTYSAGTTTVTFNTAMADTNYSVITDKEGFDEHQVLTGSKTLTSFVMQSRDSAGTGVMSPTSWPYSFVVYASDPVQSVLATSSSGLASTVASTDPLTTSNPSAVGHLWVNSTSGETYVCTDITTDDNVWSNTGNGTTDVRLFVATGGTESTYSSGSINYKVHTFTSSGTFTPASAGNVDVLVVAGGGGGGGNIGGGGGAGGLQVFSNHSVPAGAITVTVGAAGNSSNAGPAYGGLGGNSIFNSITSLGGGGGGYTASAVKAGSAGGSGGGSASSVDGAGVQAGGSGTSGQGNAGGGTTGNSYGAPGGGGAGAAGVSTTSNATTVGGVGLSNSLQTGSGIFYAGGGGGGGYPLAGAAGGNGGGGAGGQATNGAGIAATANTGGGGGGGAGGAAPGGIGAAGGSGIVIIRYPV